MNNTSENAELQELIDEVNKYSFEDMKAGFTNIVANPMNYTVAKVAVMARAGVFYRCKDGNTYSTIYGDYIQVYMDNCMPKAENDDELFTLEEMLEKSRRTDDPEAPDHVQINILRVARGFLTGEFKHKTARH